MESTDETRIMIVEDESIVARDIAEMLTGLGYLVSAVVQSGEKAIKQAEDTAPNLVLMDIGLRGNMDGIEAAGIIRAKFGIPVVFLTGNSDSMTLERAKKIGPFGYILKPFDVAQLHTAIEIALYRHDLEERLRKSEERYRAVADTAFAGIGVVDSEENIVFANPAFGKMVGCSQKELVGKNLSELTDASHFAKFQEMTERRKKGERNHYETILRRKDGSAVDVIVSASPLTGYAGSSEGTLVVVIDITERKKTEIALQQALKQNEQLLSSISWILIGVDHNETITHWNGPAENAFGIMSQEVIGKPFPECGIRWDWTQIRSLLSECRKKQGPVHRTDIRFTDPDGKEGFLNITVNPFIMGEDYDSPGFLLTAKDVTQRKILESQLIQAQKLESIGQLAAGIAHEINTPTQYIGDNTRFLQESFEELRGLFLKYQQLFQAAKAGTVPSDLVGEVEDAMGAADVDYLLEEIPTAIKQSLEGIDRVSRIVQAMREFSHPGTNEKKPIDLNRTIQNTITVARNEWKYVAEMKTDFDQNLPDVPCLSNEFNQVILNIILNAAHAIGSVVGDGSNGKGTITVSTSRNNGWVEIRIADTGTGIPTEIRDKIFDPFFTTKEVGKGTGQGLAIAHNVIVEKHGGTITFESEDGKGTTFVVSLPIELN